MEDTLLDMPSRLLMPISQRPPCRPCPAFSELYQPLESTFSNRTSSASGPAQSATACADFRRLLPLSSSSVFRPVRILSQRSFKATPTSTPSSETTDHTLDDQHDYDPSTPHPQVKPEVNRVFVAGWLETTVPEDLSEGGKIVRGTLKWEEGMAVSRR